MTEGVAPIRSAPRIEIERWPTEVPLFLVATLVSVGVWLAAAITIVPLLYGAVLGLAFFMSHVLFVAHVRGNGVRVGPDQLPELHAAVEDLSSRLGLTRTPEAYVMEAGGLLNALATRFLRSNMIVLFSDLLDECGDDTAARDMIVGHELGHIRAGHLRWRLLTLPASLVPFLGSALSRAREYTCDRYGSACAGNPEGAQRGLAILAAGGKHGRRVNIQALARQQELLNTGWMTLGEWLASHPPLARRVAALDPALRPQLASPHAGPLRALAILGGAFLLVLGMTAAGIAAAYWLGRTATREARQPPAAADAATIQARRDLERLAAAIEDERRRTGRLPPDDGEFDRLWRSQGPNGTDLLDPFGRPYLYARAGDDYVLYSAGPDGESATADDIDHEPGD